VKVSRCVAAAVACLSLLTFAATLARGQQPPQVAVVDVQYIFKDHFWYNQQMKALQEEVKQAESQLLEMRNNIQKLEQQINQGKGIWKPGTPDYQNKQQELAQLKGNLAAQLELQRRQFLDKEAKIYFKVYQEITQAVATFARNQRIDLVLRYSKTDDIDPNNPESSKVKQWIANPVIFQNQIDITERIVVMLKANTDVGRGPGGGAPR